MKLSVFFMFLSIGVASASSTYSQNTILSLKVQNKALKDVFRDIENQSEYIFFYNDEAVNVNKRVNVSFDKVTIYEILDQVLDKKQSNYKVVDRQVILFKNTQAHENTVIVEEQQATYTITGVVKSNSGEPLIGVSVIEKGTTNGVLTDIDGNFSITTTNNNATLTFSYIGFEPTEVQTKGRLSIDVILHEKASDLDEVIVVGYTTQRKESLTGAMQNIKADKLKDITSPSVENLLNGKVAGVYVAPGSGKPGESGAVVIRGQVTLSGSTAPLWVIDGVISGTDAGQLNPADIESMTILKDAASTAIYGSQGANGVIVVTTKGPRVQKLSVSTDVKMGFSTLNNGKMKVMNGAQMYDYFSSFANQSEVKFPRWTPELRNSNFDWWNLASQTGFTQDYNISIQGGSEQVQSYLSLGIYDEDGAIKGYDYKRYNFRFKTTYQPHKRVLIKPSISGSRRDIKDQQYSVSAMYSMLPWDSPYDEDGNLVPHRYSGWVNSQQTNYLYDLQWNNSESTNYEFAGNLDFDIKINDWLTFSSVNSYRYINNTSYSYSDPRSSGGESVNGRLNEWRAETARKYTNQKLLVNKSFGKHRINGLLAYEYNDYWYKNLDVNGTGILYGFKVLDVASKPEKTKGGISESAMQSYFVNAKYDYDSKYLAEASLRRDGASNLGDNAKYGNLFSVSGGWVINREKWFEDVNWVDLLKLRASYGTVGNNPEKLYPQYDLYSASATYNDNPGLLISSIGNRNLGWELTKATGFGLDATLFNNRLRFTVDYYMKNTDNIIYDVPITGLVGVTSIYRNIGKMRNNGIEISIGGDFIRSEKFTWGADLNISHNKNKLKDIYKQKDANGNFVRKPVIISTGLNAAGTASYILEVGEPIDTYYMPEWAGVNPENGAPMWYKYDENGGRETTSKHAEATYRKVGSAAPNLYGGFSTYLLWNNFDLSAAFGYSLGGKLYNYSRQEYDSDGTYVDRNQMVLLDSWKRWEKPGDIATHPVAKYNNPDQGNKVSSRYLEDGDYLKMRSLSLGYNFRLQQYGIKNLRVFFNGENLFTITNYSGVDPELPPVDGGVMNSTGADVYPSVRKYMFGVNVTF